MRAINLRNVIVTVLIIGIGVGYVKADRQLMLREFSRKKADFEFKDVTIAEALDNISSELGAEIVLSDEAQWKLPHGEATRLSASLKGSLAECLTEMLNAFFMRHAVSDDKITIYPRKELQHILGRPSAEQLRLLKKIYSIRIEVKSGEDPMNVFLGLIKDAFGALSFMPFDLPEDICGVLNSGGSPVSLVVLIEQVGMVREKPRWYISGMDFPNQSPVIKLVDDKEYREAVLDQVVDISFEGRREDWAVVILQKLAGWTGMELIIQKGEPSWLKEEIVVNMQNIKLRQALRNIVSSVDGEIEINIDDNRIEIFGPIQSLIEESASEKTKSGGSSGEGYVGKISIPMGEGESKYYIEFMLRERDLTEELRKLREDKIKEIIRKFSKADGKATEIAVRLQTYSILN
ncbi:MAG: hypothetical protein JSW00_05035 [Thermoplasmata archaeon]|nr:MAG: hypothetical protein JSW00_05035 [Thermoplasmata archaeon]